MTIQTKGLDNSKVLQLMRPYLSSSFKERIPDITKANMQSIAETMTNYPTIANEFIDALTNQVIRTLFVSKRIENPLSMFEKGDLSKFGKSLELIHVDLIKAKDFTDRFGTSYENEALGPEAVTNVRVQYLTENSRLKYKQTISYDMLASAFRDEYGLSTLANQLASKLVESAQNDKFLMTWKLLDTMKTVQIESVRPALDDKPSTLKFARDVKKVIKDMKFPSTKFNPSGVTTQSSPSDIYIITDTDISATLDVQLLADAFNMSKVEFESRIIEVPAFGSNKTLCYIVDKDTIQIYNTKTATDTIKNGAGLYLNMFLHQWNLYGANAFTNCVELVSGTYTRPVELSGSGANQAQPAGLFNEMPYDTINYGNKNEDGTVVADLTQSEIEIDKNGEIKAKKEKQIKK